MILPLLPIFLDRFLHATKGEIGIIEGVAEFGVALLIALSGFASDRTGKRKIIAVIGYGLSNLAKPLVFFASSALMVAAVRVGDRVGKGIRTAARDALISAYSEKEKSGFTFGFHKMMDSAGAVAGSLAAFLFLYYLGQSESSFRLIFAFSLAPGLLAILILIFLVSDAPIEPTPMKRFRPSELPKEFYYLVTFQTLFSLAAMNYSFMILKAGDNGIELLMIPLAYTLYNLTQSAFAIPIGRLADRFGKASLLAAIYAAFGFGALVMALGTPFGSWIGFGIYGFFAGGFNALAKAIISDTAPTELKATAYGIYYVCVGFATLISLILAGAIWDSFGSDILFTSAGCISAMLAFALFRFRNTLDIKRHP